MTELVVILAISVLALAFGGTVLERRINALKSEIDELRKQFRADSEERVSTSEAEEKQI